MVNDLDDHCDLAGVKRWLGEKHNAADLDGAPSGKMLEYLSLLVAVVWGGLHTPGSGNIGVTHFIRIVVWR